MKPPDDDENAGEEWKNPDGPGPAGSSVQTGAGSCGAAASQTPPPSAFTPGQDAAIKQVYAILSEHFDGAMFAVMANNDGLEATAVYSHGGHAMAVGLSLMAHQRILNGNGGPA